MDTNNQTVIEPENSNRDKVSRRRWISSLGMGGILSGWAAAYMKYMEPYNLEVTFRDISPCFKVPVPKGLKILHLSDFHASFEVPINLIEKAIDLGLQENPDIVFLTGDLITWKIEAPKKLLSLLSKLSSHAPTFACPGNHDGGNWARKHGGYSSLHEIKTLLSKSNIQYLENKSIVHKIKGMEFQITGLGDLWADEVKPQGLLPIVRDKRDPDKFPYPIILLAHNPDTKVRIMDHDWDLMLSGHTHGGQLVIPVINYRPFIPVHETRHPEGLKRWENNRWVHITRGVGNRHGVRFNCRPEVSLLTT